MRVTAEKHASFPMVDTTSVANDLALIALVESLDSDARVRFHQTLTTIIKLTENAENLPAGDQKTIVEKLRKWADE